MQLFRDDQDFSQFMVFLVYALKASGCTLWAFALMTNHYHLVLRGSSAELTGCMRRINAMYSRYHNRRYNLDGHAFDGPYQAFRQTTALLMLHTIAYVLFNPVKGGLSGSPEGYPWSSARSFLGLPGSPLEVDAGRLMETMGVPIQVAWTKFHQAMEQQARRSSRPSVRPTMIDLHQEQFLWIMDHAKENSQLLAGEDPLLVAMHWAREVGVTPKAMARVLGRDMASVRNSLYKFNQRLNANPDLKSALSQIG